MDKNTEFRTGKSMAKYAKDRCPHFDSEKISFKRKSAYNAEATIVSNGKLKTIKISPHVWNLDLYLIQIENYCITGVWDDSYYTQPYTTRRFGGEYVHILVGRPFKLKNEEKMNKSLSFLRTMLSTSELSGDDIGFEQCPPTDDCIVLSVLN